jgi:hypothetical protein
MKCPIYIDPQITQISQIMSHPSTIVPTYGAGRRTQTLSADFSDYTDYFYPQPLTVRFPTIRPNLINEFESGVHGDSPGAWGGPMTNC